MHVGNGKAIEGKIPSGLVHALTYGFVGVCCSSGGVTLG